MSSRMFSQQSSIGLNHRHLRLHRHCRSIDHLTQSILSMFKILFLSKITKTSFQKNPIQIAHPTTSIYSFLRMKKFNLTLFTLWFILLRNQIRSEQISLFEAAFQGECRKTSPCQQLCFDLHDGTFECACNQGYRLDLNGYSCIDEEIHQIDNDHRYHQFDPSSSSSSSSLGTIFDKNRNRSKIFSSNQNNYFNRDDNKLGANKFYMQSIVSSSLSSSSSSSSKKTRSEFLRNKTFSSQSQSKESFIHLRKTIEENRIESNQNSAESATLPLQYSCNDVECEAGGVCVDEIKQSDREYRIRCKCPLGRGGQFCEKIIEVKQPRFKSSSYLALPTLRNAFRSLRIYIEFKPNSYNGLLLYSGQEPNLDSDFIAIILREGFVEFRMDCGMGEGIIRSDLPINLNAWNTIDIYRDGRNAWMQLNQGRQIFGHSKGLFSRITFRLETFLGGSPNISQISDRIEVNNGFEGCVRNLKINDRLYDLYNDTIDGIDIEQCRSDICKQITCLNGGYCSVIDTDQNRKQCICPLGFSGEFCEKQIELSIPQFNGSSHLQFIGLGEQETLQSELLMIIKPNHTDGLFLYNGQKMDRTGDFISLNLIDGFVEFRFDLGSGAAVIRSPERIAMNEWHTIHASRTGRQGWLRVDDQPIAMGLSLGGFQQLSLPLNLYIGGVPNLQHIHHNVQANENYHGCIQRLIINNHHLSLLKDVLSGTNIDNCQHRCQTKPCQNNGYCEPFHHQYHCRCVSNSYFGKHCEKGLLNNSSGLILWFGRSSNKIGDYLSIGLNDGTINVDINLGDGNSRFILNETRIDNGQWHQLDLIRFKRKIFIQLDRLDRLSSSLTNQENSNRASIKGLIGGRSTQLNVQSALYLGGVEDTVMMTNDHYQKGFIGCISNLTLNLNNRIDLMADSDRGINIRACI
ncbi:putative splicing factor [Sarcoptes scabiei]|nr:putative splicing factor [Sarcoptes scabiei]